MYKFRGKVEVPPLEMVDDAISENKCEPTSLELGDFITKEAYSNANLVTSKSCAYAILTEIRAFLTEIPLGRRR